jgi:hypothetical protein
MRANIDTQKLERLMQVLGREAQGSGCIYFTGGASALLIGWRNSTVLLILICLEAESRNLLNVVKIT